MATQSVCAAFDLGHQMDATTVNWTLPWRSEPIFSWSRSDAGSDLLWEMEMRLRRKKTGDVMGRPSCRSLSLGGPGAKSLSGKLRIGTKNVKRSLPSFFRTIGTTHEASFFLWEIACELQPGHLLGVPPSLMHCSLPPMPFLPVRGLPEYANLPGLVSNPSLK